MIELQEPQNNTQIERRDIDQIIEEPDGPVILKFQPLSSREDPSLPGPSNYRRSFPDTSRKILVTLKGIERIYKPPDMKN